MKATVVVVTTISFLSLSGCKGIERRVLQQTFTATSVPTRIPIPFDPECEFDRIAVRETGRGFTPHMNGDEGGPTSIVALWEFADGTSLPLFGGYRASRKEYLETADYYIDHWNGKNGLPDRPGRETLVISAEPPVELGPVTYECLPSRTYGRL